MSGERESIVSKIVKLFALADPSRGGSEHEVALAMAKAKELMAQHGIYLSDVQAHGTKEQKAEAAKEDVKSKNQAYERKGRTTLRTWESHLASAVNVICETGSFITAWAGGTKSVRLIFYGTQTDVAVASALYKILHETARRWAKDTLGGSYGPDHRNYCEGFAYRIWERAHEPVRLSSGQTQQYALVRQTKQQMLASFREELGLVAKRKSGGGHGAYNPEARAAGYRDGGRVDLGVKNRLG